MCIRDYTGKRGNTRAKVTVSGNIEKFPFEEVNNYVNNHKWLFLVIMPNFVGRMMMGSSSTRVMISIGWSTKFFQWQRSAYRNPLMLIRNTFLFLDISLMVHLQL